MANPVYTYFDNFGVSLGPPALRQSDPDLEAAKRAVQREAPESLLNRFFRARQLASDLGVTFAVQVNADLIASVRSPQKLIYGYIFNSSSGHSIDFERVQGGEDYHDFRFVYPAVIENYLARAFPHSLIIKKGAAFRFSTVPVEKLTWVTTNQPNLGDGFYRKDLLIESTTACIVNAELTNLVTAPDVIRTNSDANILIKKPVQPPSVFFDGVPIPIITDSEDVDPITGASIIYRGGADNYESNTPPSQPGVYTATVFGFRRGSSFQCGWATSQVVVRRQKTVPTITINTSPQRVYNGKPQAVTVSLTPKTLEDLNGLTSILYSGATALPFNAGTYKVFVSVSETERTEAAEATKDFVILKAPASISFSNTKRQYTGTGLGLTVTTTPPGLNHIISYDGVQNELPIQVGTYAVQVAINDKNYSGTASTTFEITPGAPRIKPNQVFTFRPGSPVTAQLVANETDHRPVTMWQVKSTTAMPAGLKFDTRTGVFSGRIDAFGTIALTVVATGAGGTDEKTVTFRAANAAVFLGKTQIKSFGAVQKLYYGNIPLYP